MNRIAISALALGLNGTLLPAQQQPPPSQPPVWHAAAAVAPSVAPSVAPRAARDSSATRRVASRNARRVASREAERLRRRVDIIDGAKLKREANTWLSKGQAVGFPVLTSGDDQTAYVLVRRAVSSRPEVHARWDDVVLVRSGTGAIELGDSLIGSTYRAPGERIGGNFAGGYRIVVHGGDIVRIPAAVPHSFVVSSKEPLEYLVIKQRRQELPIRWFGEP